MATSVPSSSHVPGAGGPPLQRDPPHPSEPIPRRYTVASFDNLVVLANYEERLREARRMVWRDRGEPAVEVHDLWECLEHGTRGGLRTFSSQNSLMRTPSPSPLFRCRDSRFRHSLWGQPHSALDTY
jgi:hypothetical protein